MRKLLLTGDHKTGYCLGQKKSFDPDNIWLSIIFIGLILSCFIG